MSLVNRSNFAFASLVILAVATIGYGHLWWRGEVPYSRHSDWLPLNLAAATVLHDAIQAGSGVPLWRADQLSGYPAVTNPQSIYFYPPYLLFYIVAPNQGIGLFYWFHFLLAGLAFYLAASALGLGSSGRLLVSVAGTFNFKLLLAVYAGWVPVIPIITLLPVLFAATWYTLRKPGPSAALGVAAAGALCVSTGHAQLIYYSLLFLALHAVWSGGQVWRRDGKAFVRRVFMWLLAGSVLALGLTSAVWLPVAREASLLSRTHTSYEFFLSGHSVSFPQLLTFLHPELLGTPLDDSSVELWEDVAYFGLIPLLLASVGAVLGWRRSHTPYLVACFILSAALSMDGPLVRILWTLLPGFDLFRLPGRFLFLTAFFGISLAGTGIDELCARLRGKSQAVSRWLLLVCVVGITAEGVHYARKYLTTRPAERLLPRTQYGDFFAQDHSVYRIASAPRAVINYGWAAPMGLHMITGYDSYSLRHYQSYLDIMRFGSVHSPPSRVWTDVPSIRRLDLLDALNVKYLVLDAPTDLPEAQFVLEAVFRDQPAFVFYRGLSSTDLYVYRNKRFLPRAFPVPQVIGAENEEVVVRELQRRDLRQVAIVLDSTQQIRQSTSKTTNDPIRVVRAEGGYLELETDCTFETFTVIGEVWHPGWRATLDGQPLTLYQTDLALIGAAIPAGRHRLVLCFNPMAWPVSLWVTGLSALALGLLVLGAFWQLRSDSAARDGLAGAGPSFTGYPGRPLSRTGVRTSSGGPPPSSSSPLKRDL